MANMFQVPIATKLVAGAGAGLLLLGASTTAVFAAKPSPSPSVKAPATSTSPAKPDRRDRAVALGAYIDASASLLGTSATDLRAALKGGKSLSDLAIAKGFSKETFGSAVQKTIAPLLAADVKSGKLTERESARFEKHLAAGKLPLWDRHAGKRHHHHKAATPKA